MEDDEVYHHERKRELVLDYEPPDPGHYRSKPGCCAPVIACIFHWPPTAPTKSEPRTTRWQLQAVDAGYRDDNIKNAKGRLSCQYCQDPKEQGYMQILVFNWRDIRHPEAGGAEVNIHEQAKRWVGCGHRVTLFTARPKGQRFRDNIDGIEIIRAGGRFSVYLWAVIAYLLILRKRADVVLDIENGIPFSRPSIPESRKYFSCITCTRISS